MLSSKVTVVGQSSRIEKETYAYCFSKGHAEDNHGTRQTSFDVAAPVIWNNLLGYRAGLRRGRARLQIAAATLSGNSLRQTVHTHRASVHQTAKLVAALLRVARVTAGLAGSNGSLPPGV